MKKTAILIIISAFLLFNYNISAQTSDSTLNWNALQDSTHFYMDKSDFETALKWAEKAEVETKKEFGEKDTNYLNIHDSQTAILNYLNKFQRALESARIDSVLYCNILGNNCKEYANYLRFMGIVYTNLAMYIDAENRYKESINILDNLTKDSTIDKAMCYQDLGSLYRIMGKFNEAEFFLVKSLEIKKNLFGEKSLKYASALKYLALNYSNKNMRIESIKINIQALSIINEIEGETLQYAILCSNIAWDYCLMDKYKDAKNYIQKALEVKKRILGSDKIDYAESLYILSSIENYLGNYSKADSILNQAMNIIKDYPDNKTDLMFFTSFLAQIAENKGEFNRADSLYNLTLEQTKGIYGDNHLDYFVAKENLSLFYIGQKKFDEAKTLLEECRIARNKFDNKESYKVLFYFYDLYKEMGDYSKAENYLLNANSIILQSKDGVNSPEYSSGLMYLASLYLILNRFDEAEKLLIRSLDLRKKNNEENSFSVANGLINLGVFYQEIGRFNEAERLLIQGNSATKIATGDNSTSYATALNNLAILYYDIGQNDKCIELLKKAIDIDTLNYGSDNPKLALDYINIAGFYSKIKNFEEAEKYVKMALNLFKSLSSEDLKYATILTRAGGFYLDIVDYSKAEKYYIEGLKIIERFLGKNFIEYISPINNLSILYRNMGRLDESKTKILECISILEKNRWINRPEYKTSLFNLAATYRDLKDFDNADSTYNLAIQKSYDLLNNTYPYLSEIEKILYREKIQDDFYYFMNYTVNRYQNNNKIAANFFDIELNTKSKIFDYMKDLRTFSISSNDTNVVNLNKNYYNLKKEIGKLSSVDEKQLMNLGINLDSVVKLANDIEKELSLQVSSLAKINDKAKINWQNINNKLVHGEAAIELVRFPKMFKGEKTDTIIYAALILKHSSDSLKSSDESNKSPELVLLENGNDLEEKYFAKYSKIIRDLGDEYRNGNKLWTDSYIKNMLKDMYINFWQKIQEKLAGVKTVYLSVDGVYNKINLNTLINPETNKYLAEELDLHIVTSTRDLVNRNLIAGNNQSENKTAELFGSPKFNLDSNEINDISKKYSDNRLNSENSSSNNKLSRGSSDTLLRGLGYDELPGTKIEIEKISEILKSNGWTAKTHTGKDATEESVKSVRSPKILHIATHGEFDKDIQTIEESDKMTGKSKKFYENPLLKSKLILAGGENTRQKLVNNESIDSSIEDGYLTAYEVMNMNLDNTELVVLSACETGLGEIRNGEGVYGLQRAFQVAGAKSLIMSLWKVPDAATQELMLSFYSKWLGGMDKRESFRQSQMELAKKYANFFYWGAFEIITNY